MEIEDEDKYVPWSFPKKVSVGHCHKCAAKIVVIDNRAVRCGICHEPTTLTIKTYQFRKNVLAHKTFNDDIDEYCSFEKSHLKECLSCEGSGFEHLTNKRLCEVLSGDWHDNYAQTLHYANCYQCAGGGFVCGWCAGTEGDCNCGVGIDE